MSYTYNAVAAPSYSLDAGCTLYEITSPGHAGKLVEVRCVQSIDNTRLVEFFYIQLSARLVNPDGTTATAGTINIEVPETRPGIATAELPDNNGSLKVNWVMDHVEDCITRCINRSQTLPQFGFLQQAN